MLWLLDLLRFLMHSELLDVCLLKLFFRRALGLGLLEVVFGETTCDDCAAGSRVFHIVISYNATWSLSRDNVSDVLDTLIVKVEVTEV